MSVLEELSDALAAELQVAAWSVAGFGVKRPRIVEGLQGLPSAKVAFVDCVGDVCTTKYAWLPAEALSIAPNAKLMKRLVLQPHAIAALAGMLLVGIACAVQAPATDALLSLLGGRVTGTYVFCAACLAHMIEAIYAVYILVVQLRKPFSESLPWAFPILLIGFPVTRWVLRLQKAVGKTFKRS